MNESGQMTFPIDPDVTGFIETEAALNGLAELCRKKRLAVLVGPGASRAGGLDWWEEIERELRSSLRKQGGDKGHTYQLAGLFEDELYRQYADPDLARKNLIKTFQNILNAENQKKQGQGFGPVLEALATLPICNFFTTNWDELLLHTLQSIRNKKVTVLDYSNIDNEPGPASPYDDSNHLVLLHGHLNANPNRIIATSSDCFQFERLVPDLYRRLVTQFANYSLLCIGYGYSELSVLVYLHKALEAGHPSAGIYTLSPGLSEGEAHALMKDYKIRPIACDAGPKNSAQWVRAFLNTLGTRAQVGNCPFDPPAQEQDHPTDSKKDADFPSLLEKAKVRLSNQGLKSPLDWFTRRPPKTGFIPNLPPKHPLLDEVYVERDIKQELLSELRLGHTQGISGLLGIGGVGKSFLAMKVAWELIAEGWNVAWIGLLDQTIDDGLNQLARVYNLIFLQGLALEEKAAAIHQLFQTVSQSENKTLIILDNAEKFQDLRLILEAVAPVTTLVTSRSEECHDLVQYRRIDAMTKAEASELCHLCLKRFDPALLEKLDSQDRDDLSELCRHLGYHPLGIRLVMAGTTRLKPERQKGNRPFRFFLEEIKNRGLEALPPYPQEGYGRAGEKLHHTLNTTFNWLYQELPQVCTSHGGHAHILLPLMAALGANPITKSDLVSALRSLKSRVDSEIVSPPIQPPPAPVPEKVIGSFGIDQLSPASKFIKIPAHNLQFDEVLFLKLLAGSVSLTKDQKKRIILAIPKINQFQMDSLLKIFEEEKSKFSNLELKHKSQLRDLEKQHAGEWEALCREFARNPTPKPQNTSFSLPEVQSPRKLIGNQDEEKETGLQQKTGIPNPVDQSVQPQEVVGTFGVEHLSAASKGITIASHKLIFDEKLFLKLLAGSISLTKNEKKQIIQKIPQLKQKQIDELIKILTTEKKNFSALDVKHRKQLRALERHHASEWEELCREFNQATAPPEETENPDFQPQDLVSSRLKDPVKPLPGNGREAWQQMCRSMLRKDKPPAFSEKDLLAQLDQLKDPKPVHKKNKRSPLGQILEKNPPPDLIPQAPKIPKPPPPPEPKKKPAWNGILEELVQERHLVKALKNLLEVSLIDKAQQGTTYQVHPLIREFALGERLRAEPQSKNQDYPVDGPSMEYIFSAALTVLSPSREAGTSLLDLLPRLASEKSLTMQACRKILGLKSDFYFRLEQWHMYTQLLKAAADLAKKTGLKSLESQLLCSLGETLHRMEYREGAKILEEGVELRKEVGESHYYDACWSRAFLFSLEHFDITKDHFVKASETLRQAHGRKGSSASEIKLLEDVISSLSPSLSCALQMGLSSSGDNFITNAINDLEDWLAYFDDRPGALEKVEELFSLALKRKKEADHASVSITPAIRFSIRTHFAECQFRKGHTNFKDFEKKIKSLQAEMRIQGFKGLRPLKKLAYQKWHQAAKSGHWAALPNLAESWLRVCEEMPSSHRAFDLFAPETIRLTCILAAKKPSSKNRSSYQENMTEFFKQAEKWSRDRMLGWLLLCRAFLSTAEGHYQRAVAFLVRAKSAVARSGLFAKELFPIFYERAVARLEKEGVVIEDIQSQLNEEDQKPPRFQNWFIKRDQLPKRVRCRADGKTMVLVEGGLQPGPTGGEFWLYPFYMDETPVTGQEYLHLCPHGKKTQVLGNRDHALCGMTHSMAETYAKKSGKQLPNAFEWYATRWQHAYGQVPPRWDDWDTASTEALARIETVIKGGLWGSMPLLPGHFRSLPTFLPENWLVKQIKILEQGTWVREIPGFLDLLAPLQTNLTTITGYPCRPERAACLALRIELSKQIPKDEKQELLFGCLPQDLPAEPWVQLLEALEQEFQGADTNPQRLYSNYCSSLNQFLERLNYDNQSIGTHWLNYLVEATWLKENSLLQARFQERAVAPIGENQVGFSQEDSKNLAQKLVVSPSLTGIEKKRIVAASPQLSHYQLKELKKICAVEQEKFRALESKHLTKVINLYYKAIHEVVKWLYHPEATILKTVPPEMIKTWWSDISDQGKKGTTFLHGDPLNDATWFNGVQVHSSDTINLVTGLRCVLPIHTKEQLDLVEEIKGD